MGFYRSQDEYLDIVLTALKKLKHQNYQLASLNLSRKSESAYAYFLKDRNKLIRLRLSAHGDHLNRTFSTIMIKSNIQQDAQLADIIAKQLQSCADHFYLEITPKLLTLLEFINTSTFKTHQGKLFVDVVNNQVIVKYPNRAFEFDYSDFRDEIRACVDLNLLRSKLFSEQHMLQLSYAGREVLRMFVRLETLKLKVLMQQMKTYTDIHDIQNQQITISKISNYRLKQWRSKIIQVAKQIKLKNHWFCFAADSLSRQKWVNLYFTNLDRIVVLRVGEKLYDYTLNGLNRQTRDHFIKLSTKANAHEIEQVLRDFNFEPAQSVKISYQLMITCQLLMQLSKTGQCLTADDLSKLRNLRKHYRRDEFASAFENITISDSDQQFSSDYVINRYLVLLSRTCLIGDATQQIVYRQPLADLIQHYQDVAEFKQSSVWRRDILTMTASECIAELEKLLSKNPIIS